jgi:hypothetical protein
MKENCFLCAQTATRGKFGTLQPPCQIFALTRPALAERHHFSFLKATKKPSAGPGFVCLRRVPGQLSVFVAVVAGGVFFLVLLAADGTATYGTGTSTNYSASLATDEAAYHGTTYATGYGAFSLAAPAFGLVLGLGGATGQHDESQQ